MAVLALVRIKGDAGQLAASIHQHMNPVMNRIAVENGVLSHTLCRTPEGGLVADVWDSSDGAGRTDA